jgi:error-prone DNA polymerase
MHLLAQHQPDCFGDLVTEVALFRPGPLQGGMVNPYIRRRRGLEPIRYEHPDLEPVLRDTCGVILFQEQVLEVCHHFAGMTLEEADKFRSLMSKFRDPGEMEGMREAFTSGAMRRGIDEETANSVFDKVSNFVGYGFCRSHAAAFAKTVYHSAWLKYYYPAAFMAALMQHRPGMYSMMTLEEEARRFGVPIRLPDIHLSGVRYGLERTHDGKLAIRKPFGVIKELGVEGAKRIVMARLERPFESVEDLYRRVALDREGLDALARSGALDPLAGSSRRALWEVGVLARRLGAAGLDRHTPLFEAPVLDERDIPELPELTSGGRLQWDYATHGAARYHPMILMRRMLNDLEVRSVITCSRIMKSYTRPKGSPYVVLTVAGIATLRQMPPTARGVMFITLEDETGFIQCIVLPEVQEALPPVLHSAALIVRGEIHMVGNWRGLMVQDAWTLDGAIGGYTGFPSAYGGTDKLIIDDEAPTVHGIDEYRKRVDERGLERERESEKPKPRRTKREESKRDKYEDRVRDRYGDPNRWRGGGTW